MGKKIYEDKELMKQVATKILTIINQGEGWNLTDAQIEEKVNNIINNEEKLKIHKRALEAKKTFEAKISVGREIHTMLANGNKSYNTHGFERVINQKLDISGTPEAKKANIDLYEKYNNETFAQNEIMDTLKRAIQYDNSKYITTDYMEAINYYENNIADLLEMFTIQSTIANAHRLTEKAKVYFNENKTLIETAGALKGFYEKTSNPMFLLVDDEIDPMILMKYGQAMKKQLSPMLEGLDDFKKDKSNLDDSYSLFANTSIVVKSDIEKMNTLKEIYAKHNIPNLGYEYKATLDGKSLNLYDSLMMLKEGKDVKFEKRSEAELKEIDELLDTGLVDKQAIFQYAKEKKNEYISLYEKLKSLESKDESPEFAKIVEQLESISNDRFLGTREEEIFKESKKLKDAVDLYIAKNDNNQKERLALCNQLSSVASLDGKTPDSFNPSVKAKWQKEQLMLEATKNVYKKIQDGTKALGDSFNQELANGTKLRFAVSHMLLNVSTDLKNAKTDGNNRFVAEAKIVELISQVKAKLASRSFLSKIFHPFRTRGENNVLKDLEKLAGPNKEEIDERTMSYNEAAGGKDNLDISSERREMYTKIIKGEFDNNCKINNMPNLENPIKSYVLNNLEVAKETRKIVEIDKDVIDGVEEINNDIDLEENLNINDIINNRQMNE